MRSRPFHAALTALAAAGPASAAPEMLVNGTAEQPPSHGWTVTGGQVRATGLMRAPDGSLLTPAEGLGYFVFGPGGTPAVTQTGSFPMASQRLVVRGRVRTNGAGAMLVRLRARNAAGAVVVERTAVAASLPSWQPVLATFEIPGAARTWEVSLIALLPGGLGVHADAFAMTPTCLADINGDRLVNFFDLSDFLVRYAAHDPEADLDRNAAWDFFDVSAYLEWYDSFCE